MIAFDLALVALVDAGTEFKGKLKRILKSKGVELIEGVAGVHKSQGIVERWPRGCLGISSHKMLNPQERNVEWVARLLQVIKTLNEQTTRLI